VVQCHENRPALSNRIICINRVINIEIIDITRLFLGTIDWINRRFTLCHTSRKRWRTRGRKSCQYAKYIRFEYDEKTSFKS